MTAGRKKRLFKIASEINIGKDAIVDFLASKGHEIDNKATTTLTPDLIELIYDKFKREKRAAEVQREKLVKHKIIRTKDKSEEQSDDETSSVSGVASVDDQPDTGAVVTDNASKSTTEAEKIIEEPKAVPQKEEKPAVDKTDEISDEPKPFEKIDLAELEKRMEPTRPAKRSSRKKEAHESTVKVEKAPAPEVKPVQESKSETQNAASVKSQDGTEKVHKVETDKRNQVPVAEKKPVETAKDKVVDKKSEKQEAKADTIKSDKGADVAGKAAAQKTTGESGEEVSEDSKSDSSGNSSRNSKSDRKPTRRKKKSKKILEVDLDEEDDRKLPGLTIVGKIDIAAKQEQERRNKKKRPQKADAEKKDDDSQDTKTSKRRRKKTKGKEINIEQEAQQQKKAKPEDRKRKRKRKSIRESISQEDVDKAIKETLRGMEHHGGSGSRSKMRQKKKAEREEKEMAAAQQAEKESQILKLTEFVTTSDLANLMNVNSNDVILKCLALGIMVTINQRLDKDTITLIADDYGYEVEFVEQKAFDVVTDIEDPEESLLPRHPIVTIMGHVDHGKTSLLDYIRHSNVVAGEAGGITQHIGAYQVKTDSGNKVTFLDTPGHEAFTAMRARGAQVTDIVILIVAADDAVMPQTIEAISHAQAAEVPIVVAINKIDKPDANPDRIKQQLSDHNILVEDWGGKYQSVEISAKKGINVDKLLDAILLEAEMLELTANPDRVARGTVIESHMTKGLGNIATIIVQKGTLRIGDPFVAGSFSGRVRAMLDERGNKVFEIGPSTPVRVIGFDGIPEAGDIFMVAKSDSEARRISIERQQLRREQEFRQIRHVTLDDISAQIQLGGVKDLNLIIKGDVAGSVEALSDSLLKLSRDEVRVNIILKGVGAIKESDVTLASASGAIIIGFNQSATSQAKRIAENEAVEIRQYDIIYNCINDVTLALEGLLTPDIEEEILGTVEVRKVFKISRLGSIAGCYVLSGKIHRNNKVRLLRDGLEIFNGTIASLKRGKDDTKEVDTAYECGIQLDGYNDVRQDDIIEAYREVEIKRKFS